MKKKILLIGFIALALCGCGKVAKLENGKDAVVKFNEIEGISAETLYNELKSRYAINILIDMIDKEILFEDYKDKITDAEDYANDQVKSLMENYESEEKLMEAVSSYYGYKTMKEFKEFIE